MVVIKCTLLSVVTLFRVCDNYLHSFLIALPRPQTFCLGLASASSNLPLLLSFLALAGFSSASPRLISPRPRQFCLGLGLVKTASSLLILTIALLNVCVLYC